MGLKPRWKHYPGFTRDGKPTVYGGEFLDTEPNLFERIAKMPRKIPISIHAALELFFSRADEICFDDADPVSSANFLSIDWIMWISDQGYSIHLMGNEYDLSTELDSRVPCSQLARHGTRKR
jgi:hypothetical protein